MNPPTEWSSRQIRVAQAINAAAGRPPKPPDPNRREIVKVPFEQLDREFRDHYHQAIRDRLDGNLPTEKEDIEVYRHPGEKTFTMYHHHPKHGRQELMKLQREKHEPLSPQSYAHFKDVFLKSRELRDPETQVRVRHRLEGDKDHYGAEPKFMYYGETRLQVLGKPKGGVAVVYNEANGKKGTLPVKVLTEKSNPRLDKEAIKRQYGQ